MEATRNPDGTITIPRRAEGEGIIGDGIVTIGADDPEYAAWDAWLSSQNPS